MKKKIGSDTVSWLIAVGATVIIFAVMIAWGLPCPIKYMTGISCAGCGMTRAVLSAIGGEFSRAFYYHPLWFLVPIVAVILSVAKIMKKDRLFDVTLWGFAIAMLALWIVRLIDRNCTVVTVDFDASVWARVVGMLESALWRCK